MPPQGAFHEFMGEVLIWCLPVFSFHNLVLVDFTDEEGYGKYLDLHKCYERFINLKGIPKMDYITYLTTFDKLFDLPKERKNAAYKE